MFCRRPDDDQQHLARSVAPDFRSSSSGRIRVGVVVPVVVVSVVVAATTRMTLHGAKPESNPARRHEVWRILLVTATTPSHYCFTEGLKSDPSVCLHAKA